ncbi:Ribonuclease H-like domain containing protein, partial [Parasponia andersonii]
TFVKTCDRCQRTWHISRRHELPLTNMFEIEIFDLRRIDFIGPFPPSFGNQYILLAVDYESKWVKVIATPTNDAHVVLKFLHKNIFTSTAYACHKLLEYMGDLILTELDY